MTDTTDLTDREQQLLEHERAWWKYAGAKETSIRVTFGVSATRYYQELSVLVERDEALAFDPLLVKRLRRLRDERRAQRSASRLGS